MANLEFNVSRQIDGLNGDLVIVSRGQAILVQHKARIRTGWIVDIVPDGADGFKVTAVVCVADVGSKSPEEFQKPLNFVGAGFRHLADPAPTGVRFVTVAEGEEAARALHAHMQSGVRPLQPAKPVPQANEESNAGLITAAEPVATKPATATDPRDTDGDGVVSKAEQKAAKQREKQEKF